MGCGIRGPTPALRDGCRCAPPLQGIFSGPCSMKTASPLGQGGTSGGLGAVTRNLLRLPPCARRGPHHFQCRLMLLLWQVSAVAVGHRDSRENFRAPDPRGSGVSRERPNHRCQEPAVAFSSLGNLWILSSWRVLQSGQKLEYFLFRFRGHDFHPTHQHSNQLVRLGVISRGRMASVCCRGST